MARLRATSVAGSLLLGDKSQVRGGVAAEDVVVRGHIVGSIRGLRVTLQAQCHVEGDIFHQSLALEQGAYFEGKSRHSDNPLEEIKAAGANGAAKVGSHSASSPSVAYSRRGGDNERLSKGFCVGSLRCLPAALVASSTAICKAASVGRKRLVTVA